MLSTRLKQYNNTSGYRGVFRSGNRWIARVSNNNTRNYLGTFNTAEEANERILEWKFCLNKRICLDVY
jgi:hypothetical protein